MAKSKGTAEHGPDMECLVLNRLIGYAGDCVPNEQGFLYFDFRPAAAVELPAGRTLVVDYQSGVAEIGELSVDLIHLLRDLPQVSHV